MRRVLTLLLLAASAPALSRDRVPAAAPAGEPVSCLNIAQLRESRIRDDRTIDFYMGGRKVYRVTLPHACPGLGMEERFSYATSLGQLCANDIITVLHTTPVMRGTSCGLAPFQPVTLSGPGAR